MNRSGRRQPHDRACDTVARIDIAAVLADRQAGVDDAIAGCSRTPGIVVHGVTSAQIAQTVIEPDTVGGVLVFPTMASHPVPPGSGRLLVTAHPARAASPGDAPPPSTCLPGGQFAVSVMLTSGVEPLPDALTSTISYPVTPSWPGTPCGPTGPCGPAGPSGPGTPCWLTSMTNPPVHWAGLVT